MDRCPDRKHATFPASHSGTPTRAHRGTASCRMSAAPASVPSASTCRAKLGPHLATAASASAS
eukprot:6767371-Pyramimonas_sp.AAC.1